MLTVSKDALKAGRVYLMHIDGYWSPIRILKADSMMQHRGRMRRAILFELNATHERLLVLRKFFRMMAKEVE